MSSKIKIIFFGTPDIVLPTLDSLILNEDVEVLCVVTQPDKPVGRKQVLTAPPVKGVAIAHQIPVYQPNHLNLDSELYSVIAGLKPDYFVVFAYGQIMSEKWLSIPARRPLNIHASLLPKYRGASPIQESLLHGDHTTGLTIQHMDKGMDTGEILVAQEITIEPQFTAYDLNREFSKLAPDLVLKTLKVDMESGIVSIPQNHQYATYCKKISKQDGLVDFDTQSPRDIYNKFRAYFIWPQIFTYFKDGSFNPSEGKRVKILDMEYVDEAIVLKKVQMEGKSPITFDEFERAYMS